MVEPTFRGGDVALFIDWENFKISLAAGNRTPNLSSLKEEISEHGRVVVAKAYADWVTRAPELRGASQFNNDPPSLYAAGIEPVFVPTRVPSTQASSANGMRTYRVKNSVDVKMTADCIECATPTPTSAPSCWCRATPTSFTWSTPCAPWASGWSSSACRGAPLAAWPTRWTRCCSTIRTLTPWPRSRRCCPSTLRNARPATKRRNWPEVIRAIEEIIRDDRAAGGNPLLTSIKQRLMRRYPGFDEKKLGFFWLQEADGPRRRGRQHQS